MQIIEYEDRFLDDVKNLLVELEEYIIKIDEDGLDQLHSEYKAKMALLDLKTIKDNSGKCYLAIQNNMVIGLIMGYVRAYDEFDYLEYLVQANPLNDIPFESREGNDVVNTLKIALNKAKEPKMIMLLNKDNEIKYAIIENVSNSNGIN